MDTPHKSLIYVYFMQFQVVKDVGAATTSQPQEIYSFIFDLCKLEGKLTCKYHRGRGVRERNNINIHNGNQEFRGIFYRRY